MYRFLETMYYDGSGIRNLDLHLERIQSSLIYSSGGVLSGVGNSMLIQIKEILRSFQISGQAQRVRVLYDENGLDIEASPLMIQYPTTFRCVDVDHNFDYSYKFADRQVLNEAFLKRNGKEDVILIRDGWVTDTSKANLAFRKNDKWYTPYFPLLAGTTWKKLVSEQSLLPRPIHVDHIALFDVVRTFNALHAFEAAPEIPVDQIIF